MLNSRMSLWAAFAVILFITGFASAQDDHTAAEQQYRFTGNGAWVVIKTWTDDPLNKKDRIIADFGNADDAGDCRDKLNKSLNSAAPFYYRARERTKDDPTGPLDLPGTPRGTTITKPDLKSADPGPLKKGESKAPSLAGKKGAGTIGKYKVTIEFTGEGEKGEFIISGDLEGKGKWLQLGSFVQMETARAKFEGKLDGDKLGGSRTIKENGQKDEWSITLKKMGLSLTGTEWGVFRYVFKFDSGNKLTISDGYGASFKGTYTSDGDTIEFNTAFKSQREPYTRTIRGKLSKKSETVLEGRLTHTTDSAQTHEITIEKQ